MGQKTKKLAALASEQMPEDFSKALAKSVKLVPPEVRKAYKQAIKSTLGYKPEKYGDSSYAPKSKSTTRKNTGASSSKSKQSKKVDPDSDSSSEDEAPTRKPSTAAKPKERVAQPKSRKAEADVVPDEEPVVAPTRLNNSAPRSWRDALQ
jgi:hypothetical protein